jgi:uncharacterized protein (TIGR03083 family)
MTDTTLAEVFATTAQRRLAVADLLEGLDTGQLAVPSLCAGWDVRTVGGHLADAAAPGALGVLVRDLVRARGNLHRANDLAARRAGRRPVAETVRLLRERADSRFTPPVTGYRAPLAEVLVHEGDMRIPLGLPYRPDPESVRHALELFTTGRPFGFVPRGRLSGLRLVATDLDWSWGQGAELRGACIDLLLAACGRAVVLALLEGPGSALLAARLRR